ncbi:hypothetical protein KBB96_09115 [Luteolibacter ambystomatis]|uniref:Uncharacterized protein n=1 Tax=Luteolibacter ambystomatis TaxID=2824561 RepID=A0A975PH73_9BACT|nr:hypothetical protein [Luteolibacter ambystomatis]QUE53037.1 hypothetical protein KBB96_09115 [Luteolibacter ambystomatis]
MNTLATPVIHFFCEEPFKRFARIEGMATIEEDGIRFEYAMTESVSPTPKGSVSKLLRFSDIAAIELRHHWISASKLRFRARSLKAVDSYPTTDPCAFEVEILQTHKQDAEDFVAAANLLLTGHPAGATPVTPAA